VKNKKLKARRKYPKSRSHLKSREKPFVSATCQKKRISLATAKIIFRWPLKPIANKKC